MRRSRTMNIIYLLFWNLILIGLILLIQKKSFGQYQKPPSFWSKLLTNWSVNANAGRTSFYGEVSLYDYEFSEKMSKEGSWACGFELARKLTPTFDISLQLLLGELAGSNSKSHFTSDINEFSVNVALDVINMLIPGNNAGFHPYFKAGMGQFNYNTQLNFNDPNKADIKTESKSPEFILLYGGGAYYVLNHSFDINAQFMGRRMNNDKIDGTSSKEHDDRYSYLSVGLTYNINNVPRDTRYYKRMGMKSPLIRRR